MERRAVTVTGVVERSLIDSLSEHGESTELIRELASIFSFDFARESKPGDEFGLVYEKYYDRAGFVRYGKILAAQYVTESEMLTAVHYENSAGVDGYYTPAGKALKPSQSSSRIESDEKERFRRVRHERLRSLQQAPEIVLEPAM